jgi:hypothetical protein
MSTRPLAIIASIKRPASRGLKRSPGAGGRMTTRQLAIIASIERPASRVLKRSPGNWAHPYV